MTISLYGIGWFTGEGYGCIRKGQQHTFDGNEGAASLPKKGLFAYPFKNFGRLDAVSRSAAYGIALALQDAGMDYAPGKKRDIGIIGTNAEGSFRTDKEFFEDYIRSGRTLSRGNLFIYTLPSSPLGEAAIHFGFLGPLLYAGTVNHSLSLVLDTAADMVASGEAELMMAGRAEEHEAIFFLLGKEKEVSKSLRSLPDVRPFVDSNSSVGDLVRKLSLLEYPRKA